ncbi:helix-turn-helix transcriptional regulator [Spongiactinospora sp. TRM90649]|uniref:helix-turn-helix domain-containing protein n=1 Tax=Spongiactinospora sp. TRM90649 TaxID=3031114 RepID=UPI0023F7B51C|nr:helix-turn-helix transcriptional regulator [Spongiactinospora sp. TRM90649]MDF5756579.1 helix-turn-helix transcriptional regulator [Spongiactinospora sp. TRM90649]
MDVRTLPAALQAIMEQRKWTQSQLADALGVSQTWVSQVSRGIKDTTMGKAIELLSRVGWEVRISPQMEEPVERREFLTAAGAVIFIPGNNASANPYEDADYVSTLADSLARGRYELGGVPLTPAALGHVHRIRDLADRVRNARTQRAISQLMYQVTLVLYDAGKLSKAEYAGRLALDMAILGADDDAQARALDGLSRVSQEKGEYARGVAYARKGLALHDLPDSRVASLNMRLGRSLASIHGREVDAPAPLDLALNVSNGLGAFAQAAMIGDVAIGLGQLKRFGEANRLLGDAAERIGEWSPLFRAQYLGRQAITTLRAGQIDFAADRINGIARALPFISSARVNKRVREILHASAKWNHVREVREARERLEAMQVPETGLS